MSINRLPPNDTSNNESWAPLLSRLSPGWYDANDGDNSLLPSIAVNSKGTDRGSDSFKVYIQTSNTMRSLPGLSGLVGANDVIITYCTEDLHGNDHWFASPKIQCPKNRHGARISDLQFTEEIAFLADRIAHEVTKQGHSGYLSKDAFDDFQKS